MVVEVVMFRVQLSRIWFCINMCFVSTNKQSTTNSVTKVLQKFALTIFHTVTLSVGLCCDNVLVFHELRIYKATLNGMIFIL